MKYIFSLSGFIPGLYFCNHDGKGFRLSNNLEDAIVMTDPKTVKTVVKQLEQQSGFRVQVVRINGQYNF